jgi:hypothetical protein
VAVKSDVKTGHDIAYVTRGHASGCAGAMAYYTRPRTAGNPMPMTQQIWRAVWARAPFQVIRGVAGCASNQVPGLAAPACSLVR